MDGSSYNCPNCGSALSFIRFDNFLTCRYCGSQIASVPIGSTINLIDITNNPNRVAKICEELVLNNRYGALRSYSEILLRDSSYIIMGRYYKCISMLYEGDPGVHDYLENLINTGNYWAHEHIFLEFPKIYVNIFMQRHTGSINQNYHVYLGHGFITSLRGARPSKYGIDSLSEFTSRILDEIDLVLKKELTLNSYYKISKLMDDIFLWFICPIPGYYELCQSLNRADDVLRTISNKLAFQPFLSGVNHDEDKWESIKKNAIFFDYAREAFGDIPSEIDQIDLQLIKNHWDHCYNDEFSEAFYSAYMTSIAVFYSEYLPFSSVVRKTMESKINRAVLIYFSPAKEAKK